MIRMRKSESGQIAVLSAIFISLFLLAFAALAVDVGFLYASRRNLQTVADAAAIAGANALNSGLTCTSGSCAAAQDVATLNGYTNGVNGVTVTPVVPPTVKPNPSDGTYVEIDVSQPVPTYFLRALDINTVNVGAKAVAGYAPPLNCIYALDPNNDSKTFVASGSAVVDANCGIQVESTSSDGMDVSGGAKVNASPGTIGVVGSGYTGGSSVTPTPQTKVAPVADPLASLAPPPQCSSSGGCTAACDHTNYHPGSSTSTTEGVYCGGITVSGGNTLTLGAGTYVLIGGGLTVSASTLKGTGVTFYNTYNASNPYKAIALSGSSSTTLSAPTSGQFNGVLFFQDRTAALPAKSSNSQETISGASGASFQGALYFPNSPMTFSGGSSTNPDNMTLIAYTITFSGSADLTAGSSSGSGTSITTTKLYE